MITFEISGSLRPALEGNPESQGLPLAAFNLNLDARGMKIL
jgi:hypothetical protein